MNLVDLLLLCTCTVLLMKLSKCVPCIQTIGANTVTCDIDPDDNQYCSIHCELVDPDNPTHVFCSHRCRRVTIIPCDNFTTSDQYQLCCTTPYCNNVTSIPLLPSLTPTQTSTSTTIISSSSTVRPKFPIRHSPSTSSDTPTPSDSPTVKHNPSSNGTNKDTSDDLYFHAVIAVCIVVVVLVIAIVTGFVAVMWIKQGSQQNNGLLIAKFRQRTKSIE